jgi:hypothetical protein
MESILSDNQSCLITVEEVSVSADPINIIIGEPSIENTTQPDFNPISNQTIHTMQS